MSRWPQSQLASAGRKHAVGVRDRACRADAAAGRHFEVARVDALPIVGQLGPFERPTILDRGFIASSVRRSGKPSSMSIGRASRSSPVASSGIVVWQPDVDVETERRRDFVLEELSEAAMLRIHASQKLALVEAQRDAVVALPRAGRPRRFLARQHDRQTIEVVDERRDRRARRRRTVLPDAPAADGR